MKKLTYILLFFIISNVAIAGRFEITPVVLNFSGVLAKADTIIAFGNHGSMLMSYNNAAKWQQVRAFEKGKILCIFMNDDRMVAFSDYGSIAVSKDKGKSWIEDTKLQDSIFAVINYPDGYLIRGRQKISTLTIDLKVNKEYKLFSDDIRGYGIVNDKPDYKKSICFFKNNFIVEIDTSSYIRLDKNLKPLDTLALKNLEIFNPGNAYLSGYCLGADSNYFYMKVLTDKKGIIYTSVYRTNDFKSVEYLLKLKSSYSTFNIINDKFYTLHKNEKFLFDNTKVTDLKFEMGIKDFTVEQGKMIAVGDSKFIAIIDLKDSSLKVVSDFTKVGPYFDTEKTGDSTYLFFSGSFVEYDPYIYKTDDNWVTLKPTVDKTDPKYESNYTYYTFRTKYYDDKQNTFYLGGLNYFGWNNEHLLTSNDNCKSFSSKVVKDIFLPNTIIDKVTKNAMSIPNVQRLNDTWVTSPGWVNMGQGKDYTAIFTMNKDYEAQSYCVAINMAIDYFHSTDTNTFLIHCANTLDSTSEIRYTNDKGVSWEVIKKYPMIESFAGRKCNEIELNGKKYIVLNHVTKRLEDTTVYFDVVDLESRHFKRVFEWKSNKTVPGFSNYGVSIGNDGTTAYISFNDTLFYATDLYDKSKWKYHIIPNGGRITFTLKKYGDSFLTCYQDKYIPASRGIFWLKPLDSLESPVSVKSESEIETGSYFYNFPPFPIPASHSIRSLIYWDGGNEIDYDQISVYNIYGIKVAGKEKVSIEKLNNYSGYLVWDCADMESGVYLIDIKHGTISRTIQVIIKR